MSDLFGNPEDRFSRVAAHMLLVSQDSETGDGRLNIFCNRLETTFETCSNT